MTGYLRDIKDNIFLQLVLVSKVKYLITGDKDLLVLKKVKSTKIITTEKFFELETNFN